MDLKQIDVIISHSYRQPTVNPLTSWGLCDVCLFQPTPAASLSDEVKRTRSEQFYKSVITFQQFGERWVAVDCNLVCLWPSVSQCQWSVWRLFCTRAGWCRIHLSVTQKQMSPGRWGAADCRGDQAVAGWRCLRPAGPSRWKLRSLSAVRFVALFPSTTTPCLLVFLLCRLYCKDTPGQSLRENVNILSSALRH